MANPNPASDPNLINRNREYSCCSITFHNDSFEDAQRGCLCVARSPFAPEPIQDNPNGDNYVILSVRRLYGKVEDFTVGKWTVSFGTSPATKDPKRDLFVTDITRSDIVRLYTCCTPNKDAYGKTCRCQASFSVLVLHKKFCEKLRVQIELRTGNKQFRGQFVPLSIHDVTRIQTFPVTYKHAVLKKKKLKICKNVPLEGYFALEGEEKVPMLGEKVKVYSECVRCSESENHKPSLSGSAILDTTLSCVTGVHNVQCSVPIGTDNYSAMGTSVFQMASQLMVQQFEQGGVSLAKKYLPAVLAVIVANINKVTNTELVQKAYQATENIVTTAEFNVVELRELTLYLHQSGIVDLHWHTDHRAYRVNSGLKLMLTILYKYNNLPIAQSPVDGWELGDIIPKAMFEDTIVQYGEKLDDCLKRMMEGVKEHHDVILMCLDCWNLIVSDSDMAKKKLITTDHQEYLKTLIDSNKLENYPKLQSCLLQSYILITDYFSKNWIQVNEERDCLKVQVSNLEQQVLELNDRQAIYRDTQLPDASFELIRSNSKNDDFVVIDINPSLCTTMPNTTTNAAPSQRPSQLPCSPTTTPTPTTTTTTTTTMTRTSHQSSPESMVPSANHPPQIERKASQEILFAEQFVDEQPCQDLLKEIAKVIHNSQVTIDALCVELGIPQGDIRNLSSDLEVWVKIFRLLEGWRERDVKNNTRALARALYSLGLSRCVEECELFKRIE